MPPLGFKKHKQVDTFGNTQAQTCQIVQYTTARTTRPASIKLYGTNRQYIDQLLPSWENHYARSVEELFNFADTIIITTNEKIHQEWIKNYGHNKTIKQFTQIINIGK